MPKVQKRKNGMMEHWNIGLTKKYFGFFNIDIIPSFQYSIIPRMRFLQ